MVAAPPVGGGRAEACRKVEDDPRTCRSEASPASGLWNRWAAAKLRPMRGSAKCACLARQIAIVLAMICVVAR